MSKVGLFARRSPDEASVPERLETLARKPDVRGLIALLDSLDDDGWEAARRWYRKARTSVRRLSEPRGFRGFEHFVDSARIEAMLCVALAPPASAAKWLRWEWMGQSAQLVGPLVVRRGAEWCRDFVPAIDARPARGDRWTQSQDTYRILRDAVDAHGLPTPTGVPFVEGWMMAISPQPIWRGNKPAETDLPELLTRLRAEPRLDDLVQPVLTHPQLGQYDHLATGFAVLAKEGRLDRTQLVELCLAGLDAPGRPATQKALAAGLIELGLRSDELPGGLARLQQLLATCHGSVTARLLPLAFDLVQDEDDLVELTTTIASRPEKKQRTDLLRAITAAPLTDVVPVEGRRAALEILADSPDAALAGKAARALEALGGAVFPATASSPAALGLWSLVVADTSEPVTAIAEPDALDDAALALVRQAAEGMVSWPLLPPWHEPVALSVVVRWSFRDGVKAVRRAITEVTPDQHQPRLFGSALAAWQRKRLPPAYAPVLVARTPYEMSASPLAERHLRESLHRAGRAPFLLSTPTHSDASLDFGVLVERLRRSASAGFGPLDLLVAILRVGPVGPDRAIELDGLAPVSPDPSTEFTTIRDAVAYLRDAVANGRLRPRPITPEQLAASDWVPEQPKTQTQRFLWDRAGQPPDDFWQAMLPVPLTDFGTSVEEIGPAAYVGHRDRVVLRSLAPWHPDLRLRSSGLWQVYSDWWQGQDHLDSRAPVGMPGHDRLLAGYAADRPDSRRETVELTLAWIGAGRYSVEPGLAASWARLKIGRLNLARCAAAWEQVFLAGGIRAAWPVALGTAAMAAELPRKPAGLADLLRMLTQYIGEVPEQERLLPPALIALAQAKGTTKSHAEARLLAAAARGGRQ